MARTSIHQVTTQTELEQFVDLPWRLYRTDPCWVPPMRRERLEFLSKESNPFLERSEAALFYASKNGKVVGTIAAVVNGQHAEIYHDQVGFFGFFECIDDPCLARELIAQAAAWLRGRGMRTMRGPMNLSVHDPCGLLVDGFDSPPVLLMTYNPPYYGALLEGAGLVKLHDLLAYRLDLSLPRTELAAKADEIVSSHDIRLRRLDMGRYEQDMWEIRRLYNESWTRNWGYLPLPEEDFELTAAKLRSVIDPRLILLAEIGDATVGFGLALPDLNQALIKTRHMFFPLNILRFLLARRRITTIRGWAIGVHPDFRSLGLAIPINLQVVRSAAELGYSTMEVSWTHEQNRPVRALMDRFEAVVYKRYRIYEMSIDDQDATGT